MGFFQYEIYRNGVYWNCFLTAAATDRAVQAAGQYIYTITVRDYHGNPSTPTSVTVQTPVASAMNPRQVGVRPTGTYWGAAGEQIDMRAGNLNFTLPLLKAQGRGGQGVTSR